MACLISFFPLDPFLLWITPPSFILYIKATHWKDPDAGRGWGQEEKGTTEDEMAGWHHRLNGHEFEWTRRVGDGQGGLACCDSWGCKEPNTTEWLNWTEEILLWFSHSALFLFKASNFMSNPFSALNLFDIPFCYQLERTLYFKGPMKLGLKWLH